MSLHTYTVHLDDTELAMLLAETAALNTHEAAAALRYGYPPSDVLSVETVLDGLVSRALRDHAAERRREGGA